MRRMMLGMSQEKLGEAFGLTFQQVQKYLIATMGRQELRAMLSTMKPEERTAAMRKVTFRMAALEAEPELSGVPELLHRGSMKGNSRRQKSCVSRRER